MTDPYVFRVTRSASNMMLEYGVEKALLKCQEFSTHYRREIEILPYYDRQMVDILSESLHYWMAVHTEILRITSILKATPAALSDHKASTEDQHSSEP